MKINITICGRMYDAGPELPDELDLPSGATVDDALQSLQRHGGSNRCLVRTALIAISGQHIGTMAKHPPQLLQEADELLIFAPVAGG